MFTSDWKRQIAPYYTKKYEIICYATVGTVPVHVVVVK